MTAQIRHRLKNPLNTNAVTFYSPKTVADMSARCAMTDTAIERLKVQVDQSTSDAATGDIGSKSHDA